MAITTTTLRPGFLVSLKTSLHGNVQYSKNVIEAEHVTDDGAEEAKWETERRIADPKEYEAAKKARAKASTLIRGICARSAFGLLCPEDKERDLEKAIADAREVAEAFNGTARLSRVTVYVITGRIAQDDVEAVRAINSEVRDLLEDMRVGIKNLNVESVRDAANRARNLGTMLTPDAQARIQIAIDAARGAARKIVKAGDNAAQEIDKVAMRRIAQTRTAFLDLDDTGKEIAAPTFEGRAVDFDPSDTPKKVSAATVALDME